MLTTLAYCAANSDEYRIIPGGEHIGTPTEWHEGEEHLKLHYENEIAQFAKIITFVGKSNLPARGNKIIRIGEQNKLPTAVNLLIIANKDKDVRGKMLESIAPIQREALKLENVYVQFTKHVGSLKALSFFAALFTFKKNSWSLEVGNQSFMHTILNPERGDIHFPGSGLLKCNVETLTCSEFWSQPPITILRPYPSKPFIDVVAREQSNFINTRTEKETLIQVDAEIFSTLASKYMSVQECCIS
jgi:hypothetical protein